MTRVDGTVPIGGPARAIKVVVVEPDEADRFVIHLPDGSYVAVYPTPLCSHRHRTSSGAAECRDVADRVQSGRWVSRGEPL